MTYTTRLPACAARCMRIAQTYVSGAELGVIADGRSRPHTLQIARLNLNSVDTPRLPTLPCVTALNYYMNEGCDGCEAGHASLHLRWIFHRSRVDFSAAKSQSFRSPLPGPGPEQPALLGHPSHTRKCCMQACNTSSHTVYGCCITQST
eukprot:365263-Chlamydomonas_euryale.AAC.10